MNSYHISLNQVIEEIEKNLTNKIEYRKLAKIVGTSDYTLQRIFNFLTGMTLTDYIRKRRLTKAAEELQKENTKIIDIAVKYQYDSPISFSRAFQKMHGVAPSKIKQGNRRVKAFPKLVFKPNDIQTQELEYHIETIPKQVFYGKGTKPLPINDKKSIATLWAECKKDGTLDHIIQNSTSEELYYGAVQFVEQETKQRKKRKSNLLYSRKTTKRRIYKSRDTQSHLGYI